MPCTPNALLHPRLNGSRRDAVAVGKTLFIAWIAIYRRRRKEDIDTLSGGGRGHLFTAAAAGIVVQYAWRARVSNGLKHILVYALRANAAPTKATVPIFQHVFERCPLLLLL